MMNKKRIKIAGIGVILIIIVVLGWSLVEKDDGKIETGKDKSYRTVVIKEEIRKSEPVLIKNKPKEISWQIGEWTLADKVVAGEAEVKNIGDEKLKILAEELGIDWSTKDEEVEGLILFSDVEGEKELVVDKKNKKISFAQIVIKLGKNDNKSMGEIENIFFDLIEKITDKKSVKIEEMSYKKLVYPRWVNSDNQNGQAIEIKANYNVDKLKVRGFEWETIRVIFGLDGRVLKLEIGWPVTMGEIKEEFDVRSFEDIQSLNLNEFLILSVEGDEDYQLATDQEKIRDVIISDVELAYIYSSADGILVPYLLFDGQAKSGDMIVDVLLGLKAIK